MILKKRVPQVVMKALLRRIESTTPGLAIYYSDKAGLLPYDSDPKSVNRMRESPP